MDRHEAELIKKIVDEVWTIANQTILHVADHPIGLDSHIEHISCLLKDELDVVRIIGIYGSGGIGKTTIAKAIFNKMFKKFEGSSFLANVREVSSQHNGLALLQKQLLSDVLMRKDIDICNEDRGIIIIKERLRCKRVLIVLDDVEKMEQFCKLVGRHGWFCLGSRIILTTRDENLLNKLEVDEKYMVKTMNQYESLQLFSHHAFQENYPLEGYEKLSNEVIHYAGGLPLALKVLGSLLWKKNQVEWENDMRKLRKIPNDQILEKLEISYNGLDDFDKIAFLHISCLFIGYDKNIVIPILDACGVGGEAGIKLLTERSLVTIDESNKLCMHDLIRDMGREIVRKQSPGKPGGRSRLWDNDDSIDVLADLTGTDAVEGLQLDLRRHRGKEPLITAGFFKMPNLRLLEVHSGRDTPKIEQELSHQECFKNLVWVSWTGFPWEYIPNNFDMGNLVILDMPWSKLIEVWNGTKYLTKLKEINLSNSKYLTHTPDFSWLPNLEKLILSGCENLVEVHKSLDRLEKLVRLDLSGCYSLKNLSISDMSRLALLETLDITYCQQLKNLLKQMRRLISCNGFCFLREVFLKGCNLTDDDIPDEFWMLYSLESLNLSSNYFESFPPSSIGQLSKLQTLDVRHCERLKSLPMLPSSLRSLDASFCYKLERLPNLSKLKHLMMLHLSCCTKLSEIEGLEDLISSESIKLDGCINLKSFVEKKIFQDIPKDIGNRNVACDIVFNGNEVPEWFGFQSEWSDSLSCQVPNMEIQGLIICFVCTEVANQGFPWDMWARNVVVDNKSRNLTWSRTLGIPLSGRKSATWVMKIPNCVGIMRPSSLTQRSQFDWMDKQDEALVVDFSSTRKLMPKSFVEYGDNLQVSFFSEFSKYVFVEKIGVHFFCASSQLETVHFFHHVSSTQHENVKSEEKKNSNAASPENSQASDGIQCFGFFPLFGRYLQCFGFLSIAWEIFARSIRSRKNAGSIPEEA